MGGRAGLWRRSRAGRGLSLLALAAVLFLSGPSTVLAQDQTGALRPRYEFSGQLRARAETRSGAGENPARQDGLGLTRVRLTAKLRAAKNLRFVAQLQDARVIGLAPGRGRRGLEDPVDFREGYLALGPEDGVAELFVGRKQLEFLDQRLIGARRWSNTSPMFDGAQLVVRRGEHRVHLLGYSQVNIRDGFNTTSRSRYVYGAIGSISLAGGDHRLEPILLASRREESRGAHSGGLLRTAGARVSGTLAETWDYQVIMAGQVGGKRERPQRAWMGVWGLAKTLEDVPARPRFAVEWSQASGDDDPDDGRTGTFDTMFPAPHRIYGEMDLVALRNLRFLKAGVALSPAKGWRLGVDWINLQVDSTRDAFYSLNMRPGVLPPAGGAASPSIGQELDFVLRYNPTARVELRFGASRFFAGPFVLDSPAGGESQTFLTTALQIEL